MIFITPAENLVKKIFNEMKNVASGNFRKRKFFIASSSKNIRYRIRRPITFLSRIADH